MRPLTIELTKGTQRKFQSIGWKTPKGDDCRRHFYALDQTGKPVVVTPKPAMPEFYDLNRRAKAVFTGEPFPEAVCVEISPCRLLAPPCYRTQEELDGVFLSLPTFDPWQWVYWKTHKQFLILEPADEGPLKERMDKWLAEMRTAHEYKAGALRDRIKQVRTATLQELGLDTEEKRAKRLGELRAQLDIVESEDRIDGVPCKGRLKLTLEEVKRGAEGIRDARMQEEWAKKNGEDLGVMAQERRAFRRWLETHTGTRANIIDATTGRSQLRQGIEPPHFGEEYEQNPQFLEACACVRYRARFADNTIVYLSDCKLNEEPSVPELDEVVRLRGTADPRHIELLADAQRMLSDGLMLNVGQLVENMTPEEKLLFNWLVAKNPKRPGWARSYRDIGERMSVSQTEVQRRRDALERKHGRVITRCIAEARAKNEKGLNPDQCDSGRKRKTDNISPDAETD
jgi:hypothetical protein